MDVRMKSNSESVSIDTLSTTLLATCDSPPVDESSVLFPTIPPMISSVDQNCNVTNNHYHFIVDTATFLNTQQVEPQQALLKAREAFARKTTFNVDFRITQLKRLQKCMSEHQDEFVAALQADFRKPKFETVVTELEFVKADLHYQLEHIRENVKPRYVTRGLPNLFDTAYIRNDPYGVVLIFGAWNYPIQVLLCPLIGAIAAGNCAVIKPSEVASNTEKVLAKLLPQYLDKDCYHVLTGGPDEATKILNERYDMIFFTGSTSVGKIIYQAAAKHLTHTVLELGGKSPVYIDDSVGSMEVAVKRILWGKFINTGQTCIAPDYVLCNPKIAEKFVEHSKKILKDFYLDDPKTCDSFGRIINRRNFDRLNKLLKETNGKVAIGGEVDAETNYIAPTIVTNVGANDSLMSEELFGPILPIVTVESAEEAVDFINKGEKPLTFYIFSTKKSSIKKLSEETSSGSVLVNDTLLHMCVHTLPFGGVGNSGMGRYHGIYSFQAFSHEKSVLVKDFNPLVEWLAGSRYPPYTDGKLSMMKMLIAPSFIDYVDWTKTFGYLFTFAFGMATMFATGYYFKML